MRTTRRLEPVTVLLAPVHDGNRSEALSHLAALDHLNRMIAGFAAMVGHETRSSLVGIQGWSELIRDGGLSDEEIRRCATDIFDGAQRIEKLIGQMFDLNQLEPSTSRRASRLLRSRCSWTPRFLPSSAIPTGWRKPSTTS